MKIEPWRIVVAIDVLLLLGATLFGFTFGQACEYGSMPAFWNFLTALCLMPANFLLMLVTGLIYVFGKRTKPFMQSWAGAFTIGFGVVLLLNTPVCFAINAILC